MHKCSNYLHNNLKACHPVLRTVPSPPIAYHVLSMFFPHTMSTLSELASAVVILSDSEKEQIKSLSANFLQALKHCDSYKCSCLKPRQHDDIAHILNDLLQADCSPHDPEQSSSHTKLCRQGEQEEWEAYIANMQEAEIKHVLKTVKPNVSFDFNSFVDQMTEHDAKLQLKKLYARNEEMASTSAQSSSQAKNTETQAVKTESRPSSNNTLDSYFVPQQTLSPTHKRAMSPDAPNAAQDAPDAQLPNAKKTKIPKTQTQNSRNWTEEENQILTEKVLRKNNSIDWEAAHQYLPHRAKFKWAIKSRRKRIALSKLEQCANQGKLMQSTLPKDQTTDEVCNESKEKKEEQADIETNPKTQKHNVQPIHEQDTFVFQDPPNNLEFCTFSEKGYTLCIPNPEFSNISHNSSTSKQTASPHVFKHTYPTLQQAADARIAWFQQNQHHPVAQAKKYCNRQYAVWHNT